MQIDPSFRAAGAKARARQKARRLRRLALFAGLAGVGIFAVGLIWMLSFGAPDGVDQGTGRSAGQQAVGTDDFAATDGFTMVEGQAEEGAQISAARRASFLHLRRDPMILRFEQGAKTQLRHLAGPTADSPAAKALAPDRVGPFQPRRLAVLRDRLVAADTQLITNLPSSRADFAMFQAQRSKAMATPITALPQATNSQAAAEIGPEDIGDNGEGSWGAQLDDGKGALEPASFRPTLIENTTSVAFALRDGQRQGFFEDVIVVLQRARALKDLLLDKGFDAEGATRISRAAARELGLTQALEAGSVVALRLRNTLDGTALPQLLHMSIYAPDGYLATLAQVGAGRFITAADPWVKEDLLQRSDALQGQATVQEVRLLDALYSAAIRGGMSPQLVGEMMALVSQRFDLDRFAAADDEVTLIYADTPGAKGQGVGQILYVGITGASGRKQCYVTPQPKAPGGYECFDFTRSVAAAGGGLGGGLQVPTSGVKTSGFGPRHHPILKQVRNHNGVDWAAPTGTPVRAALAGTIQLAGVAGGYGKVIYIDHGGGVETRYAHLNGYAKGLRKGQKVTTGELIGYVGTTGRSTGPHLHFELRVHGKPRDPLTYRGPGGGVGGSVGGGTGAVEALVNQIIKVESAGNARAKNSRSTATGLGQFIESTWLRMMRDYRPDLSASMSRAALLELRFDPVLSREMVRNLARENESFLRRRGHQITPGRLYLAHFLGPAGAHTALRANPDQTVLEVMGSGVVNANPFLRGKSIANLWAWSDRKMRGRGGGGGSTSAPMAVISVPPEVKQYRQAVDGILKTL